MPRVLNVGQCGFDHGAITRHLRAGYNAEVVGADTANEALISLRAAPFDLVLINRVLDADGSPGLDLIRALRADPSLTQTPVILVSNYPEAQAEARKLGALPGFGKGDLRAGQTIAALDEALAGADSKVDADAGAASTGRGDGAGR